MNNETEFFNNLRQAIARGTDASTPPVGLSVPPQNTHYSELLKEITHRSPQEQTALVEEFLDNSIPLNIKTSVVDSFEQATATVIELVRSKDPEFSHNKHVILHDQPLLNEMQLWKRFNREAVTVHTSFAPDPQIRQKTVASFIGITAPDIGVAESATLVEFSEPGRPRSTSLVPSIHIAIITREKLVSSLEEAYVFLKNRAQLNDVVFITGPSKTADIEAQLVHGAHGPKEVHVIIIAEPFPDDELEPEDTE